MRLFPAGSVEVLVVRSGGAGSDAPFDPKVKVVHSASAISVECSDYAWQTKNLIAALIRSKIELDTKGTNV